MHWSIVTLWSTKAARVCSSEDDRAFFIAYHVVRVLAISSAWVPIQCWELLRFSKFPPWFQSHMVYLPSFGWIFMVNQGKYTILGSYENNKGWLKWIMNPVFCFKKHKAVIAFLLLVGVYVLLRWKSGREATRIDGIWRFCFVVLCGCRASRRYFFLAQIKLRVESWTQWALNPRSFLFFGGRINVCRYNYHYVDSPPHTGSGAFRWMTNEYKRLGKHNICKCTISVLSPFVTTIYSNLLVLQVVCSTNSMH